MSSKTCGAKTRSGTPCKRAPRYNGRCNLHGGKSLMGIAHPNFKEGRYSKYHPYILSGFARYNRDAKEAVSESKQESKVDS